MSSNQEKWNGLTDEQKAKAQECKTSEEFRAFMESEGIQLSDEQLDAIAGGDSPMCPGFDSWCRMNICPMNTLY